MGLALPAGARDPRPAPDPCGARGANYVNCRETQSKAATGPNSCSNPEHKWRCSFNYGTGPGRITEANLRQMERFFNGRTGVRACGGANLDVVCRNPTGDFTVRGTALPISGAPEVIQAQQRYVQERLAAHRLARPTLARPATVRPARPTTVRPPRARAPRAGHSASRYARRAATFRSARVPAPSRFGFARSYSIGDVRRFVSSVSRLGAGHVRRVMTASFFFGAAAHDMIGRGMVGVY
ncbi:MAG: hypothetical protein HY059_09505 [Proteobacteria bacterium]|nr:hypothetical protein [Pseudomonadota bacterium]